MNLKSILSLCQEYGFLLKNPSVSKYNVAPAGSLLLENLRNEWMQSMVNCKDYSIFYTHQNFIDSYNYVRKSCFERLPFGFASESKINGINEQATLGRYIESNKTLNAWVFIPPANSVHAFHQWQRQRRMWWRKFSAAPGRYFTTDIISENESQKIEILAKYPWGNELVEVLTLSENHPELSNEQLINYVDRKKVSALTLGSQISVSTMYMNTICDAYEVLNLQQEDRSLLKFHRKMSPYKVGFSVSQPSSIQQHADLKELTIHLCKKLRSNNVSSLLLPNFARATLEAQFKHFDHLGIPYIIVLGENTLKNGILYLRCRDTSIKEQVHITDLSNYINQLFMHF